MVAQCLKKGLLGHFTKRLKLGVSEE